MIPAEAVEAAAKASWEKANSDPWISGDTDDPRWADRRVYLDDAKVMLEAAAPYMLIHVHHHDIEKHAESFNEGYETCMAQELADDPTTAQDWLDEKLRAAKEEAWSHGHHDGAVDQMLHMENGGAKTMPNPYMLNNEGEK